MAKPDGPKDKSLKWCRVCNQYKPEEAFAKNQFGKNNRIVRRPVCKECYAKKVKPKSEEKKLYESQHPRPKIGESFTCPICHKTFVRQHQNDVVLDHSHKDGSIRGWTCSSCNTSMGKFNDDVSILQRAIKWIQRTLSSIFC